jgi:hypothetical protein
MSNFSSEPEVKAGITGGAALAGVSAFLMTLIVQATDSTFSEEVAIIAAIVTLALLLSTLFYASILQDIRDGELDLEKIE